MTSCQLPGQSTKLHQKLNGKIHGERRREDKMPPNDQAVCDCRDELQNCTESSSNIQVTAGVPATAGNEFLTAKERNDIFALLRCYAA
jgi:hypothetical protein